MSTGPVEHALPPQRGRALYLLLRDEIVRCRLAPGTRLSEADVSLRFGVSRSPVREALARLRADGLVVERGSRTRTQLAVADLDSDEMADLYDTMGVLEGAAAAAVAERSLDIRRRSADALEKATRAFAAAARRQPTDFDRLFETHRAFHELLVHSCERPKLRNVIAGVRHLVDRYEYAYAPLVGSDHSATVREHLRISNAIRKGSRDAAERAARANYGNGAVRLATAMRRTAVTRPLYPPRR